jgi:hypothetical protein
VSRRSRIVGFGSAGLLVLAGVACAVIFSGTVGQNLAFALVAIGLVVATCLVFYEVGLTEDRDRARQRRAADRARKDDVNEAGADGGKDAGADAGKDAGKDAGRDAEPPRPSAGTHDAGRSHAPGLDRMRRRPRRLR